MFLFGGFSSGFFCWILFVVVCLFLLWLCFGECGFLFVVVVVVVVLLVVVEIIAVAGIMVSE